MANRLYQGVIHQMKDAINRTVGIIDESGVIVACSDPRLVGESRQGVREELAFSNDAAAFNGFTYRFISIGGKNEGIVFVEGDDAEAGRYAAMLAVSLGNIKSLYDEKYDKGSFIKNIMLDNILPSDIYIKSKELHFSGEDHRVVLIIK
ncbi:MAG: PucR family transcriptional regulator, partial [Clostridia bacterium]|nr:PucR family transcriptional regulator [Clostridia bacterium]